MTISINDGTGGTAPTAGGKTSEQAAALRALHVPGRPLVLPNVWDAASARAVEAAGFPVIATGSAAIAPVLGYDDGEQTPVEEMLAAVARIGRSVSLPVTADVERGYRLEPAELVARLAAAGACGCNLEDSDPATGASIDADEQAGLLRAVRAAAEDAGTDLVINARIDVFMNGTGSDGERLAEAVRRARLYLEAGADCVYPIFAAEAAVIRELTGRIDGPVNILFRPGTPSLAELAGLGVARVSFGHGLHRSVSAYAARMFAAIRDGESPYPPDAP